jgi:hypothetical protein
MQDQSVSTTDVKNVLSLDQEKSNFLFAISGGIIQLFWTFFDQSVTPDHWELLMYCRVFTFILPIALYFFRRKIKLSSTWCLFLVAFSIAALTGFASSLMNLDDFRQFSIAYVILFVGIGMLVTWEWTYSVWFMLVSFSFTVCAFYMNSTIPVQDIMANGGFSTISVACLGMIMIYSRYRSRFNEVRSRLELANSILVVELKTSENNAMNEQLHQN